MIYGLPCVIFRLFWFIHRGKVQNKMEAGRRHTADKGYCSECSEYFQNIAEFHSHCIPTDSRKRDLKSRDQACFDSFSHYIPADDDDADDEGSQDHEQEAGDAFQVRKIVCALRVFYHLGLNRTLCFHHHSLPE